MTAPVAVSANLLNGRRMKPVLHGIDAHLSLAAPVVAFQEAGCYLPIIRDLRVEHGYRAPIAARASAGRGMNSSVLLTHASTRQHASGVAFSRAPWIGPRLGVRWPGRGIPWAIVDLDGHRTLVASIHAPTGRNGVNAVAWRAYLRRLRRLVRKKRKAHPGLKVLLIGDWNCPAAANDATSVRRLLADRLGLRIVRTGTPIDYAVTDLPLTGSTGPRYGSDHPSTRYHRKADR